MKETYKDDGGEEEPKKETTTEELEEKAQTKKVNPQNFFKNLIKSNQRDSLRKGDKDQDKEQKVAEFKKKLQLDTLGS
jgi:hypothetical protein